MIRTPAPTGGADFFPGRGYAGFVNGLQLETVDAACVSRGKLSLPVSFFLLFPAKC